MTDIIETMARAIADKQYAVVFDTLNIHERQPWREDATAALRAAKAEGWELCRFPEPQEYSGHVPAEDGGARQYWADGFSSCLDEIERLELEGDDG